MTIRKVAGHFRSSANIGHSQIAPACLKSADSVAKVVLQEMSKILRAAGAFFV
jgi:hypothetical protein